MSVQIFRRVVDLKPRPAPVQPPAPVNVEVVGVKNFPGDIRQYTVVQFALRSQPEGAEHATTIFFDMTPEAATALAKALLEASAS